mgnify:CR=1 FL=1
MLNITFLQHPFYVPIWFMSSNLDEPITSICQSISWPNTPLPPSPLFLGDSYLRARRLRHDGWDGQKMARFCEVLAETGVVTNACRNRAHV